MDTAKTWGLHGGDPALKGRIKQGTVLGVSYDQGSGPPAVNFFVDGVQVLGKGIESLRGLVAPAVGVSGGASVTCNFGHTHSKPPPERFQFDGVIAAGKMM